MKETTLWAVTVFRIALDVTGTYLKFLRGLGGTSYEFFFLSTLGAIIAPPLVASRAPIWLWLREALRSPVPVGLLLSHWC